jgi:hypothetical protein
MRVWSRKGVGQALPIYVSEVEAAEAGDESYLATEDRQCQLLSRGQVNGGGRQVEARTGGSKGRGEVCDGDGEAGLDRDGGGGLPNRDRSRIGARAELDRVKGKQTDGYRKRASSLLTTLDS